jgi:hypothetical protein
MPPGLPQMNLLGGQAAGLAVLEGAWGSRAVGQVPVPLAPARPRVAPACLLSPACTAQHAPVPGAGPP